MADSGAENHDRYSEELLKIAYFLLTVDNPLAEARYGTRLNELTAEPSETMAIIRNNARSILFLCESGEIEDLGYKDNVFILVELRIQLYALHALRSYSDDSWRGVRDILIGLVFASTVWLWGPGMLLVGVVALLIEIGYHIFAIAPKIRRLTDMVARLEKAERKMRRGD